MGTSALAECDRCTIDATVSTIIMDRLQRCAYTSRLHQNVVNRMYRWFGDPGAVGCDTGLRGGPTQAMRIFQCFCSTFPPGLTMHFGGKRNRASV